MLMCTAQSCMKEQKIAKVKMVKGGVLNRKHRMFPTH